MVKNQRYYPLLFLLFSVLYLSSPYCSIGQQVKVQLAQADSLFGQKKYTESFEIYQSILDSTHQASHQMLLKMAFIKEGLGDYSQALFYLNEYYAQSLDMEAKQKMDELAQAHMLRGYEQSDWDYIFGIINKNIIVISAAIFIVCGLLLAVIYHRKKKGVNAWAYAFMCTAILSGYALLMNYYLSSDRAIVIDNHAYLMSSPSSGSELLSVVKKGHRVRVIDADELWSKIHWGDTTAYLKSSQLRVIAN